MAHSEKFAFLKSKSENELQKVASELLLEKGNA